MIWNVEQAEPVNIIDCHTDVIFSMSWNRDGSLFSTTSKDKTLRVVDPRAGKCVQVCHHLICFIKCWALVSESGHQSRGCEFEPKLGNHTFRRLTKVNATRVFGKCCGDRWCEIPRKHMKRNTLKKWLNLHLTQINQIS